MCIQTGDAIISLGAPRFPIEEYIAKAADVYKKGRRSNAIRGTTSSDRRITLGR